MKDEMSKKAMSDYLVLSILKAVLKPGLLYGIGADGEVYCVEASVPRPGETIRLPPLHMPTGGDEACARRFLNRLKRF